MENEWVNSLRNLQNSQIADLFNGVCLDCQALLKSRLHSLCHKEVVKEPSTSDLSRFFASETSNTQSSPVNNHQEHNSSPPQSREYSPSSVTAKPQILYRFSKGVLDPEKQKEIDDSFYEFQLIEQNGLMEEIYNDVHTMDISKFFAMQMSSTQSSPVKNNQQHSNHRKTSQKRESANSVEHEANTNHLSSSLSPVTAKPQLSDLFSKFHLSQSPSYSPSSTTAANGSSPDEEEWRKASLVVRKKNFMYYERIAGKNINVVQGLELHTGVFNPEEQKKIVDSVYEFQWMGQKGWLMARTYSEPKKWMRGKGRVTIQFGCCYNYAEDKDGNPPGIIRDEEVDPLPPIFKQMIRRMVRWHVLPPSCIPNSCIVNIYDEGDCIPPHIDHHDFLRPFCTVSFLTECKILFGSDLKILGPGEFTGPVSVPLPVGSVLVLNGNGADIAKHCVPAVPAKRISVTFRKMDDSKIPYQFSPDSDLLNIKPLVQPSLAKPNIAAPKQHQEGTSNGEAKKPNTSNGETKKPNTVETPSNTFVLDTDDFPPLCAMKPSKRR